MTITTESTHLKCAHQTSLSGEQESGFAAASMTVVAASTAAAVVISRVAESCASASFAASEALRSSCSRHTGNAHSPATKTKTKFLRRSSHEADEPRNRKSQSLLRSYDTACSRQLALILARGPVQT